VSTSRNQLSRSELHPKAMEEQMTRQPISVDDNKKPLKPKAEDQSHNPPSILKKSRDCRVQSKQTKILTRSDALRTRSSSSGFD
jgi:hypothetical protein